MDAQILSLDDYEEQDRIFEILRRPADERIQMVCPGWDIQVGDFAWSSPRYPNDKPNLVHLTGYDQNFKTIWYADFEFTEVRFVGPKPLQYGRLNPYPVIMRASEAGS